MKKLFATLLLLVFFPVYASHIVGGEFELLHLSGEQYQLNMILYFDVLNGAAGAKDPSVIASVWRKRDNQHMGDFLLPLTTETAVGYTQPACSSGSLVTDKIVYTQTITLPASVYSDPAGYYISWQRCCRNYSITNIFSNNVATGSGIAAGQTFYLEFPAVVKNGQPFYNSSPHLFPPLSDYACPNRPYYVNFAGTDDDKDSLVYTMTTPLNTQTADPLPPEGPLPYPNVIWRPGYSLENIIKGKPDLAISLDGFLRCTPTSQGLFVFAVKVEQYRDKEKIGESRRDFQMLVVDQCAHDSPPVVIGRKVGDPAFITGTDITVNFAYGIGDANRCLEVQVSDADAAATADGRENVGIRIIPIGFTSDKVQGLMPSISTATLTNGSVQSFKICFPDCPLTKNGSYKIGVIAYDDACALPETDTLFVTVNVQAPPNHPPRFVSPNPSTLNATLGEATQMSWPVEIVDDDLDSITYSVVGFGFNMATAGMTFTKLTQTKGRITGTLHWDAYCDIYDFTKSTSFKVGIIADDVDYCNLDNPVIATFNLNVILPGVAPILIDTDLTPNPHEGAVTLTRKPGESLDFNVTSTQADNDAISESMQAVNFNTGAHLITFAAASGKGSITSHFHWDVNCTQDLAQTDPYKINFIALDNTNKCKIPKRDTVKITVKIVKPDNNKPAFTVESKNDLQIIDNKISITLGQAIALNFLGVDIDENPSLNNIAMSLYDKKGINNAILTGYQFSDVNGQRNIQSPFTWAPDCSIFKDNVYTNDYVFKFNLIKAGCGHILGDTIVLNVEVKDVDAGFDNFQPPNVVTPNGDDCNDYLAMEGLDDDPEAILNCDRKPGGDSVIGLPKDNCTGKFQYIRIYNRWGKEVYHSTDRKFRWYALNVDAGVYFYTIEYGNRQFKNAVSVRP